MLSDSSSLQSVTRTDQMSGSDVATDTMINENDYHLDSYSWSHNGDLNNYIIQPDILRQRYCCGRDEAMLHQP